jgi:hypothetical protein
VTAQPTGVYRNVITESDGVSVNIGYLSLLWILGLDVLMSLAVVSTGFWTQAYSATHEYPFTGVATALAAIWGTFSTALTALGVFLIGDRRPMPPNTSVTTTVP